MVQRPRRITLLSLHFPPEATGNAPYSGGLARALQQQGFSVTAITGQPHYPEWRFREGHSEITAVDRTDGVTTKRLRHLLLRPPRGLRRLISEISFGVRLLLARWESPDVVVAVSPALFATAMAVVRAKVSLRPKPVVVWVQDIYTLGLQETGEGGRLAGRVVRAVERGTLKRADAVVVVHPRFEEFVTTHLGVRPERVLVIRNWTHLRPAPPIDKGDARSRLGWQVEGETVAVHTGNIGLKQGLETIVDAARLADETENAIHFFIVGDGSERESLQRRARGVRRLTFVDPVSDDDYPKVLAAADVLVVNERPGVSGMAVPSKLTSYFDAQRPVVAATDPTGTTASEVRLAEAGVVVQAGDPEAVIAAITSLSNDTTLAARLAANGRRYRMTELDESVAVERWKSAITSATMRRTACKTRR
ncbi:glycosyltransferase family 4 protein [Microbacterium sp. NPDC056736]|uniref:glycosyltransferase family 4 protein n=1 Tax=Microbacterium sp. NPDC056736 TaxID=3345932 RepID=UPI00366DA301